MTLRERRGEFETVYQDNKSLSQQEWAIMLEVHNSTINSAVLKGGARRNRVKHQVITPVEDFPKIVAGLADLLNRRYDQFHFPQVDTSRNFQITTKSGATLTYEYPFSVFKTLRTIKNLVPKGLQRL